MTFDEWMQIGIEQKWVLPATCFSHDGVPTSEEEDKQFEKGFDPCIHVVRVCDPVDWLDIYNNTASMGWRDYK